MGVEVGDLDAVVDPGGRCAGGLGGRFGHRLKEYRIGRSVA
jgi:hypothetical protein